MGTKKIKYASPQHEAADIMLQEIGDCTQSMEILRAEVANEIETVKVRHAGDIHSLKEQIEKIEKELKKFEKSEREVFFDRVDRVDLPNGALLFAVNKAVKRARCVLANLQKLAMKDAIKVEESVDWDTLEKWPDEKLLMVGTERKREEVFSYELTLRR